MNVHLLLKKNDGTTKSFPLPGTVTVIGRRQECDLYIPLTVVSRRHCQLHQDNDKLVLRDLGSRNGTFVNGERIEETELKNGDEVKIGPVAFAVQISAEAPQPQKPAAPATPQPVMSDLDQLDDLDALIKLDDLGEAVDTSFDNLGPLGDILGDEGTPPKK